MDAEERAQLERIFPTDACERLERAEQDYYSTHGQYVPPLAALLNVTRAERDELRDLVFSARVALEHNCDTIEMGFDRDAWIDAATALVPDDPSNSGPGEETRDA